MAVEKRMAWERVKQRARDDVRMYEEALFINDAILNLAEQEIQKISGQEFSKS